MQQKDNALRELTFSIAMNLETAKIAYDSGDYKQADMFYAFAAGVFNKAHIDGVRRYRESMLATMNRN